LGNCAIRLTYDGENLEIMVVSYKHDAYSFVLGEIVSTIGNWLELDFVGAGSTTFRAEKKQKGFEGDQSFYFKNAEKQYYYIATLFIIPLFTCLIVVFGWDLDNRKG